ncbi:hypothetical protein TSUD_178900 [Trifolium subterraneum]|uniref:Uncharacterized protein n=1 Tax=Trifolium subterraneum TaxID=3900 RepID=A0A2Z6MA26_TRISU|nr:hypothetical protein TSUD_178900 [Trifolium subterraneum]
MLNSADHDIKVHIKERFIQFVYPETTTMRPPPNRVKTKGVPKGWSNRPSYTQEERSTKHSPYGFEHAETQYLDTHVSFLAQLGTIASFLAPIYCKRQRCWSGWTLWIPCCC